MENKKTYGGWTRKEISAFGALVGVNVGAVTRHMTNGYCMWPRVEKKSICRHPLYSIWSKMRSRCTHTKSKKYKEYGATGIQVCRRWYISFESFVEDMGPRPEGTSLDRINPYSGYEPDNCRWATSLQQAQNRRKRKSVLNTAGVRKKRNKYEASIVHNGDYYYLGIFTDILDATIAYNTAYGRLRPGHIMLNSPVVTGRHGGGA